MELLWIISVDLDVMDQLLIIQCLLFKYLRSNWTTVGSASAIYSLQFTL